MFKNIKQKVISVRWKIQMRLLTRNGHNTVVQSCLWWNVTVILTMINWF